MSKKYLSLAENAKGTKVIQITFSYDVEILHKVRTLPGRQFHYDVNAWSMPMYPKMVSELLSWGFTMSPGLESYLQELKDTLKN